MGIVEGGVHREIVGGACLLSTLYKCRWLPPNKSVFDNPFLPQIWNLLHSSEAPGATSSIHRVTASPGLGEWSSALE